MKTITKSEIQSEIDNLTKVEHLIETNSGTYGATEACRMVGTGDPAFATRKVYETVGGKTRSIGPDEADAPGRMRDVGREALASDRRRLADLRKLLIAGNASDQSQANCR